MSLTVANAFAAALLAAVEVITPPPPVDYEKWAVDNIVFSKRESQFPGPYNPSLFPFFSDVLWALSPADPCRIVSFMKSAQLGGTVIANVFTLGSQAMDPGDFLYVHPTEDNASRWSKLKLKPMLKATASLAALYPTKSRDGGDSILFKERIDGRGAILISGANSEASLSMVTMARQVQDDLSKWETNAAGDPERQADSRSRGREFAKIFKNSTPLIKPGCRITRNFEAGTQERYHVPCPHCGYMHALEWANMLAVLDEEQPERTHFTCPDCGAEIHEHHRAAMVRKGQWIAENPKAAREHRSFYLWSAYSPLQSWERIAREWLAAKGDPASEQVFLNDTVGLAYETKGEAPPWEELKKRATDHPRGIVPAGYYLLTLGIDCQKTFVAWQVVAFGRDGRRHVVDYDHIPDHISEAGCQNAIDKLLIREWQTGDGRQLKIDLAAIDGNAWTEDVWTYAKKHKAAELIMVRGVHPETAPLIAKVKKERTRSGKLLKYASRFYNFGTSVLKLSLYRNAGKTDPAERGHIGFAAGLDDAFYQEFTAERRVAHKRKDGFVNYRWEKDPGQPNEALDTHLQAEAAAIKLGLRHMTDKAWKALEAARTGIAAVVVAKPAAQPKKEPLLPTAEAKIIAAIEPKAQAAVYQKRRVRKMRFG